MSYQTVTLELHVADATIEAIEARLQIIAQIKDMHIDAIDLHLEAKLRDFCDELQSEIDDLMLDATSGCDLEQMFIEAIQNR